MELIPILSTIILVATISTFLLAIGAYVLYKIRERRGRQVAAHQPAAVKAELVTPGEAPSQQPEQVRVIPQPVFIEAGQPRPQRQPAFAQSYSPSAQRTQRWQVQPGQFNSGYQQRAFETPNYNRVSEEGPSNKFYKYTTEGYVSPKEDKQSGALRWR
jgi:hypothetical protein